MAYLECCEKAVVDLSHSSLYSQSAVLIIMRDSRGLMSNRCLSLLDTACTRVRGRHAVLKTQILQCSRPGLLAYAAAAQMRRMLQWRSQVYTGLQNSPWDGGRRPSGNGSNRLLPSHVLAIYHIFYAWL